MKSIFIFYFFQNTIVELFGERSVLEWLTIAGISVAVQAIPYFIYLAMLGGHLENNRNPSTLRWFCVSLGVTLALACCWWFFFRQTPSGIGFIVLFLITLILSVILFFSGRKSITA